MLKEGSILAGKYRILRKIGEGGMGVVYLAEHLILGKKVAVKVLHPHLAGDSDARTRFLREARVAANLQHPNIVPVLDCGQEGALIYFVMDYVKGQNLKEMVEKGPMTPSLVLAIVRQVSEALAYLHRKNLIHRDIKPSNIIIEERSERAIVTDFGIAKYVGPQREVALTRQGETLCTPEYAAPELLDSTKLPRGAQLDYAVDLYSLALVAYELLTGKRAFSGNIWAVYHQVMECTPKPPSQINPSLGTAVDDVIRRAVEKDPARRKSSFPNVQVFYEELCKSLGFPTPERVVASPAKIWPWLAIGGAVFFLIAILVMVVVLASSSGGNGLLVIRSEVPSLRLRIDEGQPEEVSLPWQRSLAAGKHQLRLEGERLKIPYDTTVYLQKGDTLIITPSLALRIAPSCRIVSISPNPATVGQWVSFKGEAEDLDGEVLEWEWKAEPNVILGHGKELATNSLPPGTYSVTLQVRDDDHLWSVPAGPTILRIISRPVAQSAGTSTLSLFSNVPTRFYVNGRPVTGSDMEVRVGGLAPGRYTVVADARGLGQPTQEKQVVLQPQQFLQVSFHFRAARLVFNFSGPQTCMYRLRATDPWQVAKGERVIKPGSYELRIGISGGSERVFPLELSDGDRVEITGSCEQPFLTRK